ncbi:hypothetical protein DFH09DRAFT_970762 [Mycena vulgaris]|nr:hypothetical protein DFH09DRAFT_970762 [Mycena vulgaris]
MTLVLLQLWMNPTASLFTIIYHSTVLLLSHKRPDSDSSAMYSVPAIALAYLLSLVWMCAFAVMVIIGNEQSGEINVFGLNVQFSVVVRETQQLQFLLVPTEFSLLGDLAIRSTVKRQHRHNTCLNS